MIGLSWGLGAVGTAVGSEPLGSLRVLTILMGNICPWCSHGAYMVVPVKLPAEEGSDVGAMGEDGGW